MIATTSLTACAMAGSDPSGAVCPPLVEYGRKFRARAANELVLLPERSALAAMMSDYAVMRAQARACRGIPVNQTELPDLRIEPQR